MCYRLVLHDGLRRVAEHLGDIKVEWLHPIFLLEREVGIARRLADDIERSTLTLGYPADMVYMFLVDEQAHALLALVGNDFLCRERLVADGQLRHIYLTTALFDQLRQAVQVTSTAVVVDGNDGVGVFFHQGTHQVVGSLLHLRVGTLHGIQLDAVAIATGIYRRHAAATQSDAIVVATDDDDLVTFLRFFLQAVALLAVADAACQHDHLVVGILRTLVLTFIREHGTADQRLTELISEVGSTVRGFDQYLFWCLVEPLAHGNDVFPVADNACLGSQLVASLRQARVGSHVDSRSCYRP